MNALACRIAQWTADLFGSPWCCVLFGAATLANLVWCAVRPGELPLALLLSFAALWASAGIQYSGTRDTKSLLEMDRALVKAHPDIDDGVAEEAGDDHSD